MSETRVKPVYLSQEEVLNALPEKIGIYLCDRQIKIRFIGGKNG